MKVLFLVPRVPYPLEKGDKLRAYLHAQRLSREHELHLVCLSEGTPSPGTEEQLRSICTELTILKLKRPLILWSLFKGLFSSKPFQVHYFFQGHLKRRLKKQIETDPPDRIYCQLIRTSEYVKEFHGIPKTLDYMDAFSKGLERRIERTPFPVNILIKEESRRTTLYENLSYEYFDQHIIISDQDRRSIPHPSRPKIHVLPNGIDTGFYSPQEAEKDQDILFTGNMAYPPNIESACYLVQKVLPLLEKEGVQPRTLLAGVSPTRRVRELESERVEVSGWMKDIRRAYGRSKIFIAPMIMGSGLQNKLLEAMAMGLPCITTPLANEALGAPEERVILVGRTEQGLAEQLMKLFRDSSLRERLAAEGRRFVTEHYDLQRIGDRLEGILRSSKEDQEPERTI
ncbi:MAG: glycosyltransferase [Flavobacteriales bacterium]